MAVTSGFFNSVNHDRTYNAEQFSRLFDGIISNGVLSNVKEFLKVKPSSGMTVAVGPGRAWFNRTWTDNDSDFYITLSDSDILLDRIDAVVLKVDLASRQNEITVVNGAPSSTPIKPTWSNTSTVYRYPLAFIRVRHEVTSITNNDIENAIGVDPRTPFVTGLIQQASISEIYDFWREEFESWLDHLQDELDDNQAAHLQHQIDDLSDEDTALNNKIDTVNTNLSNRITNTKKEVEKKVEDLKIPVMSSEDNTVVKGYAKLKIVNPFNGVKISNWIRDDYNSPKIPSFKSGSSHRYMYWFDYATKKINRFDSVKKTVTTVITKLPSNLSTSNISSEASVIDYGMEDTNGAKLAVFGWDTSDKQYVYVYKSNNTWELTRAIMGHNPSCRLIVSNDYNDELNMYIQKTVTHVKGSLYTSSDGSYTMQYVTTKIIDDNPIGDDSYTGFYVTSVGDYLYKYSSNNVITDLYFLSSTYSSGTTTYTLKKLEVPTYNSEKPTAIISNNWELYFVFRNKIVKFDSGLNKLSSITYTNLDFNIDDGNYKNIFTTLRTGTYDTRNIFIYNNSNDSNKLGVYDPFKEQTPTYDNNTIYLSVDHIE